MGKTNESETEQVLQWIKEYPLVKQEVDTIELAMEQYALAHAVTPKQEVKIKLFESVNNQPGFTANVIPDASTKIKSINSRWKMVAAASVIIMILSSIGTYVIYNKYKKLDQKMAKIK